MDDLDQNWKNGGSAWRLAGGGRHWQCRLLHANAAEAFCRAAALPPPAPHRHDVYHLVLYRRGRNRFQWNGRTWETQPGLLCVTAPGEPHDFTPLDAGVVEYAEVTFSLEDDHGQPLTVPWSGLLSLGTGCATRPPLGPDLLSPDRHTAIARWFAEFDAEWNGRQWSPGRAARMWHRLGELWLLLASWWGTANPTPAARPPRRPVGARLAEQARQRLEEHWTEPLRLAKLAAGLHVSAPHLIRAFKRHTGLTPLQFQIRLRVQAAAELMRRHGLSCKEAAGRVGFRDPAYFSRVYKQQTGHPPSARPLGGERE